MKLNMVGTTNKGKQAVRKHGREWEVVQTSPRVQFSQLPGPWALVRPVGGDPGGWASRWVNLAQDADFIVTERV